MSAHRFFTIEMTLPYAALAVFEDQLAGLGLSISSFEKGAAPDPHRPAAEWVLQNLFDEPPDRLELESAIAEAAAAAAIAPPEVSFGDLPDGDWVGRTNKLFQPLRAGRFVLYGRHDRERVQRNRYALMVDAGQAFGTGRAPSTFGCLLALERLARRRGLGDVLDVGCGSGILGLAAARLGATTVIASDIDPIAVCVARENAAANALRYRVHTVQSDSLKERSVAGRRYDTIVSNILRGPLRRLAPAIARHMAPGDDVILAGLLNWEEPAVRSRYRAAGLVFTGRIAIEGWHILTFRR